MARGGRGRAVPLQSGEMSMMRNGWGCLALGVLGIAAARGDDRPAAPTWEGQVLPLVKARCVKCHGPAKREGKLNLATPRGVARGGADGGVVVPGRPEESLLWERIEADEMPPEEPLAAEEKALLRRWIERGAPGLPKVPPGGPEGADHWAFAPASRPALPGVRDGRRVRNAIDRFIQAALEARGLAIGPEADRATLVRRVSFDLMGLPPSPGEVACFVEDPGPDAYERMVDRYLGSPHYGERWGKYWLDAAGYADSNGYFSADSDRPLAYRYRDYVIRAWNEDRPLDRFIREQLAGDEMAGFRPGGAVTPEVIDLLVATHFLRNAPDGTGESDGNPDEVRADRYAVLEGATQIMGSALLGLTLQCARCHDHKFEPVTQRDYYQLYAVLAPAFNVEGWIKPNDRVAEAALPDERAAWEAAARRINAEIGALKIGHAFRFPFAAADAARRKALEKAIREEEARRGDRPGRIAWVADVSAVPPEVHLLRRGLYNDPGPAVEPAAPAVLSDPANRLDVVAGPHSTGRRLAFARWLTRPGSRAAALLARVTANRIWQQHFGTGLVATPENLGYSGAPPSHPELLEYLAAELAGRGWSAKALHRAILSSAAYRQSGAASAEARAIDPEDRLLWRYPHRRLDAEAIRDAMLAASGELDPRMGGPPVPSRRTNEGEVVVDEHASGARRRSVYLQQRRTQVLTLLDVFDAPSIVTNCTRRIPTTMPLQSLALLNSGFVAARARGLARRLEREAGPDADARIDRAFLVATGRGPGDEERDAARRFLESQPVRYAGRADAVERAWIDLCQMILASNLFLYVE
jgi:hypothetical protein